MHIGINPLPNYKNYSLYNLQGNSESLLHLAVDGGRHNIVCALIELGVDINIANKVCKTQCNKYCILLLQDGKTALFLAVQLKYDDIAETLLSHGAKMNEVNKIYILLLFTSL